MMNCWNGIGRAVDDAVCKYTANTQMAVAQIKMACDRIVKGEKETDFIPIKCFGKTAENAETYIKKGMLFGATGYIKTGSYKNKDGITVYTTEIIATALHILDWRGKYKYGNGEEDYSQEPSSYAPYMAKEKTHKEENGNDLPEGFATLDDDIPF